MTQEQGVVLVIMFMTIWFWMLSLGLTARRHRQALELVQMAITKLFEAAKLQAEISHALAHNAVFKEDISDAPEPTQTLIQPNGVTNETQN